MITYMPIRRSVRHAACLALAGFAVCCSLAHGGTFPASGMQYTQPPAPIERRPPAVGTGSAASPNQGPHKILPRGEHLAEWMNQHRDLTPQQQQQALQREPGFSSLSAQTQQRMRERLAQLDAMSPDQRQRLLARNEALERLTPDQRAQFRGAMAQLGSLPEDQRKAVAHTFHALRDLPPEQRISAYATGRYGPPLNDTERAVLFNLLRVEPLMPPPVSTPLAR
jgi:hypothetical protein